MSSFTSSIFRRDSEDDEAWDNMDLTIILVAVCFCTMMAVGALYAVRKYRLVRAMNRQTLPVYNDRNAHGLSIDPPAYSPTGITSYYDEKSGLSSPRSPATPVSPVPEIRITFPDDVDEQGRAVKGSVVIVKIGEKGGVGLEPLRDEDQLPKYERDGKKWDEVDMDMIGGLKEKEKKDFL